MLGPCGFQEGIAVLGLVVDIHDVLVGPIEDILVLDIDVDAAQSIHRIHQAVKIDDHIVGDVQIKVLIDRLDGFLGTAVGISCVDFFVGGVVAGASGNLDQEVAHDRGDLHIPGFEVDRSNHDGIGPVAVHVGAAVDAEQGDVDDIAAEQIVDAQVAFIQLGAGGQLAEHIETINSRAAQDDEEEGHDDCQYFFL